MMPEEQEKTAEGLRTYFTGLNLMGIVSLIDLVEEGERNEAAIVEIGTASPPDHLIKHLVLIHMQMERVFGSAGTLTFFYIGNSEKENYPETRPLLWLDRLVSIADAIPPRSMKALDEFCELLVVIERAPAKEIDPSELDEPEPTRKMMLK